MTRAVKIRTDTPLPPTCDGRLGGSRYGGPLCASWRRPTPADGMSRAEAARVTGIVRQALCDAVKRFNAEGLPGLIDRPAGRIA